MREFVQESKITCPTQHAQVLVLSTASVRKQTEDYAPLSLFPEE
jgi:hypothetical protein